MAILACIFLLGASLLSCRAQGSQCPPLRLPDCDSRSNQNLYPNQFLVHGAYANQVYTVGNVIMLVAKFPNSTCNLPDPTTLGPGCVPSMIVSLFTQDGTCYNVTAGSVSRIEEVFGFSFADDAALETDSGVYNHWVFPLYVLEGMSTSRLDIKALIIPEACNSRRAVFQNIDQITQATHIFPSVVIDTAPPQIVSVHTGKASGVYTNGSIINIVVEMSKDVTLSDLPSQFSSVYTDLASNKVPYGIPYIPLNSKAYALLIGYANTQSKRRISFLYQVGVGEETPAGKQLDVLADASIVMNGGSIVSYGTGLDVNLTSMPLPGQEGSLSHPTANKIYIIKTGEKFPPLQYDAGENPVVMSEEPYEMQYRRSTKGTKVAVELELLSADINEKWQCFTAELCITTRWIDPRLRNPHAKNVLDYSTELLDSEQIWSPRLVFANSRDPIRASDAAVAVTAVTGEVAVTQRLSGTFAAAWDLRAFPFDDQYLIFHLRPGTADPAAVRFAAAGREARANASARLADLAHPAFAFSAYGQRVVPAAAGADGAAGGGGSPYRSYDSLVVFVKASRLSGAYVVLLVAPICAIALIVCVGLFHHSPASPARLTFPAAALCATMVLSILVAARGPPVGYLTRIHLLLLQSYALGLAVLAANHYLYAVCRARRELEELLAADAAAAAAGADARASSAAAAQRLKRSHWVSRAAGRPGQGEAAPPLPPSLPPRQLPAGVRAPPPSKLAGPTVAVILPPPAAAAAGDDDDAEPFPDVTKEFSLRTRPEARPAAGGSPPAQYHEPAARWHHNDRRSGFLRLDDSDELPVAQSVVIVDDYEDADHRHHPAGWADSDSGPAAAGRDHDASGAGPLPRAVPPPPPAGKNSAEGGRPGKGGHSRGVRLLWGMAQMTGDNAEAWGEHVRFVDEVVRAAAAVCCVAGIAVACALGPAGGAGAVDGSGWPAAALPRSSLDMIG